MPTQFWLNNPSVLLKNKYIFDIWPLPRMSKEEKLNAITRIVIILSILGYLITNSNNFIIICALMISIILLFYNLTKRQIDREAFTTNYTEVEPSHMSKTSEKTAPSIKNPLMNVLSDEYSTNPTRPPALDHDIQSEPKINAAAKLAIKKNLNNDKGFPDLFRDLGDKLEFDQSMRSFYVNPNTQIPSDQDEYLKFLYGNLPSSKNVNVH